MHRRATALFVTVRMHPALLAGGLLAGIALTGAALYESGAVRIVPTAWPLPPPLALPLPPAVPAAAPPVGATAPSFTLPALGHDAPVSLSQWAGRPLLLYFWTTWCTHCRAGLPVLHQLAEAAGDRLAVVTINILESQATVEAYARRAGLTLPVLLDADGAVSRNFGVHAVPAAFFLDAEGRVVDRLIGHDADRMRRLAEKLLSAGAPR
ncbi:MAG TPA: TlpA disulfide reductase family protein [Limnochordia bacterium]